MSENIIMIVICLLFSVIVAGFIVIVNVIRGKYRQKATASNENARVATNEQPKSAVIGFALSLF